jgi:zinc/manganese transport system ATP-binding protein
MTHSISLEHITVSLGGEKILSDVSLDLRPGEFLGVIGPNGAGKSTLFRVILGLVEPQEGIVRLMGPQGRPATPSQIGYVPQSRQLDAETPITVFDFVSLALPHKYRPWLTRRDKEAVREALRLTQSGHLAGKSIGRLSGGERQRVYLAQALVRGPGILMLDEPTSNLDPGAQEKMAAVVHRVCREKGIAVLFISHDVNLIAQYADRILYLTRGHYAVGTVEEVIRPDVLSPLYGTNVRVEHRGARLTVLTDPADRVPICYHEPAGAKR